MPEIPQLPGFDHTLALLRAPYDFISNECQRLHTDVFKARIQLQKTICMRGSEAARLFYDPQRFVRQGAAPEPIRATLFGKGGIQGLDDEAHRHRKQMFMSLMTRESISRLATLTAQQWQACVQAWIFPERFVLYDAAQEILTRAVCAWAGILLPKSQVDQRRQELAAMFNAAAGKGPSHLWSRLARIKAEHWIATLVRQHRAGRATLPEGSPARTIAEYRQPNGRLLSPRQAAVEILNLLRPTVAVSVYVVFLAHALHYLPEYRRKLQERDHGFEDLFIQEVRRYYPFFPSVVARVRDEFAWQGYRFPKGMRVMLDLYSTNHDSRIWETPELFRPERFRQWDGSPFNFIPQGGGDHFTNHRCPGEWITIELMKVALDFLVRRLRYEVPEQDLSIDRSRLPALPRSRLIISRVQIVEAQPEPQVRSALGLQANPLGRGS